MPDRSHPRRWPPVVDKSTSRTLPSDGAQPSSTPRSLWNPRTGSVHLKGVPPSGPSACNNSTEASQANPTEADRPTTPSVNETETAHAPAIAEQARATSGTVLSGERLRANEKNVGSPPGGSQTTLGLHARPSSSQRKNGLLLVHSNNTLGHFHWEKGTPR